VRTQQRRRLCAKLSAHARHERLKFFARRGVQEVLEFRVGAVGLPLELVERNLGAHIELVQPFGEFLGRKSLALLGCHASRCMYARLEKEHGMLLPEDNKKRTDAAPWLDEERKILQ